MLAPQPSGYAAAVAKSAKLPNAINFHPVLPDDPEPEPAIDLAAAEAFAAALRGLLDAAERAAVGEGAALSAAAVAYDAALRALHGDAGRLELALESRDGQLHLTIQPLRRPRRRPPSP